MAACTPACWVEKEPMNSLPIDFCAVYCAPSTSRVWASIAIGYFAVDVEVVEEVVDVLLVHPHVAVLREVPGGAGEAHALVRALAAGDGGHPVEAVGVAGLHLGDVAAGVAHAARRPRQRVGLEGVGHHPVVLRIDVRPIDELAIAGERLVEDLQRAPGLAEHAERPLPGHEQPGAVLVVGPVELLRGVAEHADLEHVGPPGAAHPGPAADAQASLLAPVRLSVSK